MKHVKYGRLMAAGIVAGLVLATGGRTEAGETQSHHFDRYFNNYHESNVYKIYLKTKRKAPVTTLDQAMELIRRFHEISGGMHQVVYLVGWQFDGHDSKYPSWGEVGAQCRSSFSDDPRESLRKMIVAARQYNASVSLHINMNDAYTNSPLWQTYVDADVFRRNADGSICLGGVWDGEQCRLISHVKEWRTGLAQKRILGLLDLLPELRESGTIHIDAMHGNPSPFDRISVDDDYAAIKQIVDFWHSQGLDVTTEFLSRFDQVGYFPMVYHFDLEEKQMLQYPRSAVCGGVSSRNTRNPEGYYKKGQYTPIPGIGCLYPEAWGIGHWGDLTGKRLDDMHHFIFRSFERPILMAYLNRGEAVRFTMDAEYYRVERANGVVSSVRMKDRALSVTDNGRTVLENGDCLLDFPALNAVLAFSHKGCDREWTLPAALAGRTELRGTTYPDGKPCTFPVRDGKVRVKLAPLSSAKLAMVDEVAPRQGLGRFLEKVRAGREVKVAYLGGSITSQGDNRTHRGGWRVKTTQWLRETYPHAKIVEIDAAIGGTGSGLGVYRVGEDVLSKKPDLLFVEFACNDGGDAANTNGVMRTMEGIVRQAWKADPTTDIAFAYTITHAMTNTYAKGRRPAAAQGDEYVAAHYGIPTVDFGPRVTKELLADRLFFGKSVRKDDPRIAFAGDGVHPSDAGHDLYFASVKALFEAVKDLPPADHAAKLATAPLKVDNYETAKLVRLVPEMMSGDWTHVATNGPTAWAANFFAGDAWMARKPGSRLAFRFKGTACKIYDLLGPDCGRIRVTLDGKLVRARDRFDSYCTYYRRADLPVGLDMPDAVHTVELEIDPQQPDRKPVAFRLKDPEKELAEAKYNGTRWVVGRIMLVGELVR